MTRSGSNPGTAWLLGLLAAVAAFAARADAVAAVQVLRAGGCGGLVPMAPVLRRSVALDQLAEAWSHGTPLPQLISARGLPAGGTLGVHVTASDTQLLEQLRRSQCAALADRALREIGAFRRDLEHWVVVSGGSAGATPAAQYAAVAATVGSGTRYTSPPAAAAAVSLSQRALQLVNDVRARGTRCGKRDFAPVHALSLSDTLATVAFGHASDMAAHHYFEHQDLAGKSPADRVRASGYREQLVGENIAYGPKTVDEAVQGWLDSPGHCENIMDPRFAQMGLAFASGHGSQHGLYWVQLLAAPRA
ncbi:MAG TPA: CAP domain-containing protein [Steroidobacteraceae bacterium]|nr:CAP domain-containing protein [Steroidobacteraceae bacterium]